MENYSRTKVQHYFGIMSVECLDDSNCGMVIEKGQIYRVLVIVRDWTDYGPHHASKEHKGEAYILDNQKYPYCWDAIRFKIVS